MRMLLSLVTACILIFSNSIISAESADDVSAQSGATAPKPSGDDFLKKLSYPELDVSPRASERLQMEAVRENKSQWRTHLPLQISALATLTSGLTISGQPNSALEKSGEIPDWAKKQNSYAGQIATLVGSGWLVTSALMSIYYKPYQDGYFRIKKMPDKNQRDQLSKERLAEEYLEAPSTIAPILVNLSMITNFAASANAAANSGFEGMVVSGISAVLAFAPLIFDYRWEYVYEQHQLYKKRIYGPVSFLKPEFGKDGKFAMTPFIGATIDF